MLLQSRRRLLQQALAVPFALAAPGSKCCVLSTPDCLSQESASGYLRLLKREQFPPASLEASNVIIVAGASSIPRSLLLELRSNVRRGALVIWETHAFRGSEESLLQETFDLRLGEPVDSRREMYVRYHWPGSAMIRSFGNVIPVECRESESIAHLGGKSIAIRRRVGEGCFMFLGSMLGPHLQAEDREAQQLASGLVRIRV